MTPEDCQTIDDVRGLLRNVVRAPARLLAAGGGLATVDASQIEARALLWLACDEPGLEVYRTGGDPYKRAAGRVYGVPAADVSKPQRQVGKVAVLACLAEGTPVLTRERGFVPIETVRLSDMLWDGAAWVEHDGAICNGVRDCIELEGVWLTEDHEVLTETGWRTAGLIAATGCSVAGRSSADGRCWLTSKQSPTPTAGVSAADPSGGLTPTTCGEGSRPNATSARESNRSQPERLARGGRAPFPTPTSGVGGKAASRRRSPAARTPATAGGATTAGEASESGPRGCKTAPPSRATSRPYPGGKTPRWSSTGSTTIAGTSPATCAWRPEPSRPGIPAATAEGATLPRASGAGPSSASGARGRASAPSSALGERRTARVYDVLNAGPRNRFQAGRMIVHNCGYGGGVGALSRFAEKMAIDLAAAGVTPTQVVEGWRDAHTAVAGERTGYEFVPIDPETGAELPAVQERTGGLWRDLMGAFKRAAQGEGRQEAASGRVAFHWEPITAGEGDVICTLPSGREIRYRQAKLEQVPDRYKPGELKKAWTFASPRGNRPALWPGLLAENVTQALCRDLLALGMIRLEAAGFRVVLHVHDEVVVEVARPEQLADVQAIMRETPPWAAGLPYDVTGAFGERWSK